jgi:hypothetical protein
MFTAADIVETGADGGDDLTTMRRVSPNMRVRTGRGEGVKEQNCKYRDKIGGRNTRKICPSWTSSVWM